MAQLLLIPDPRPLDEQLGAAFFRDAPKQPGVYLMRNAKDEVLYVGKAKNLQQRLRNYRTANPDRMPRRHLRMLREIARIELQFCSDESAALEHESKLLRSLKPKFNRAGVWPGKTRFIVWRFSENYLELVVTDVPEPLWQRFGPLRGNANYLHQALSRMIWLALNANRTYAELPHGWAHGRFLQNTVIDCRESVCEIAPMLDAFFWRSPDEFFLWLNSRVGEKSNPFEKAVIDSELEFLKEFSSKQKQVSANGWQAPLL